LKEDVQWANGMDISDKINYRMVEKKVTIYDAYMDRIRLYFLYDWIFLTIITGLFSYLIINSDSDQQGKIIFGSMIFAALIAKFFISSKIRSRLICQVVDEQDYVLLVIYNESTIKINKTSLPLEKKPPDYFINSLFSTRMGTIHMKKNENKRFIIIVNGHKFYLIPFLFNDEVLI
jgi:hypothetical protein